MKKHDKAKALQLAKENTTVELTIHRDGREICLFVTPHPKENAEMLLSALPKDPVKLRKKDLQQKLKDLLAEQEEAHKKQSDKITIKIFKNLPSLSPRKTREKAAIVIKTPDTIAWIAVQHDNYPDKAILGALITCLVKDGDIPFSALHGTGLEILPGVKEAAKPPTNLEGSKTTTPPGRDKKR